MGALAPTLFCPAQKYIHRFTTFSVTPRNYIYICTHSILSIWVPLIITLLVNLRMSGSFNLLIKITSAISQYKKIIIPLIAPCIIWLNKMIGSYTMNFISIKLMTLISTYYFERVDSNLSFKEIIYALSNP